MSIVNKDQEVLENKRTPLENVDASLKDQIRTKLFNKLVEDKEGINIQKIWQLGNTNRSEWLKRQEVYLMDLDEFSNSTAEGPFQGSSSLHIPISLTAAKALHARFMQALTGVQPWFNVKSRREDSIDRGATVQDVVDYSFRSWGNTNNGAQRELDNWVWTWCTTGCGIVKDRWKCVYERYIDVQTIPELGAPKFTVDETGNEQIIPQIKMTEKEVPVTTKVFEGPELINLDNEDVLIIGGKGDPQEADSVHHRDWLTASELWTLADRGIFDYDAVEKVIKGGKDRESGQIGNEIAFQKAINAGRTQLDSESELDRYQIIESYEWKDVDGSGINSHIVLWTHYHSGEILSANYVRTMNKSGERPIFKADFHLRPGQDYGIGILEMLHPLSVEMDAIHNMRVDFGIMSNMPFGFYRASSSLNPETIYYEPGSLIPLDDPQKDVYFPNLGNRTAFGFQEEMAVQTMVERLLSVNDMTLGVMTGAQGATRTATGANALVTETNTNLDVFLQRLFRTWRQILKHRLHMLQQRIPPGLSFRVTGEGGSDYWQYIKDQRDIAGDFDFELAENSSNSNPAIEQNKAKEIMNLTLNPLAIQIGIVNQGNIYESMKNYLKAIGVKDFGKFINKPQGSTYMLSPKEEADRILHGIDVPVTPEMDHEGFIAFVEEIKGEDELSGQFGPHEIMMLEAQLQKHKQMAQALQQQAAQQKNLYQQRMNASQSQAATPQAANPQAGQQIPNGGIPAGPQGPGGQPQ